MGLLDTRDPTGFKAGFTKAKFVDRLMLGALKPFSRKTSATPKMPGFKGIFLYHVVGQQGIVAAAKTVLLLSSVMLPSLWFYTRQARKHPYRLEHH